MYLSLLLAILLPTASHGGYSANDPAAKTLFIESTNREWAGFSLRKTKAASHWLGFFGDGALTPEPISFVCGVVGLAVTIPIVVLSVPYDVLSAPFRKKTVVKFSIQGTVIGPEGAPAFAMPVVATVQAWDLKDIVPSVKYFTHEFQSTIGPKGVLNIPMHGSFGPNDYFSVSLEGRLPSGWPIKIANFRISETVEGIGVASSSEQWRIISTTPELLE